MKWLKRIGLTLAAALSACSPAPVEKVSIIKIAVSATCTMTVNGKPTTFDEYETLAAEWGRSQPEVHFQPDPKSQFECVDRALGVLRKHNLTKLGFVGNEQYRSDQ